MIVSYPCSRSAMHGAHAAVVELDALADAIRAAAEDHDRLRVRCAAPRSPRRSCRRGTASPTETRRRRCRPSCTPAARPAPSGARATSSSVSPRSVAELAVGEAHALHAAQRRRRRPSASAAYARSASSSSCICVEEPRIDRRQLVDLADRRCPRSSARFTWKIRSGVGWRSAPRSVSSDSSGSRSSIRRGADRPARPPDLERAQPLLERLLERAADRHRLADGLHLRREPRIRRSGTSRTRSAGIFTTT